MPRKPPADRDERLIKHVANYPGGVGVDELLRLLRGEVSRRTLQRRLSTLVKTERLISEGAGPATLYLLPTAAAVEENYVPLSPSGAEVRRLVRRYRASARRLATTASFSINTDQTKAVISPLTQLHISLVLVQRQIWSDQRVHTLVTFWIACSWIFPGPPLDLKVTLTHYSIRNGSSNLEKQLKAKMRLRLK